MSQICGLSSAELDSVAWEEGAQEAIMGGNAAALLGGVGETQTQPSPRGTTKLPR